MADLATLRTRLESLKAAYHVGASRIQYDGKSIDYRDAAGMREAIASLEAEIAAASGTVPVRNIRIFRIRVGDAR